MFVRMRTINRRDADEVVGAPDVTVVGEVAAPLVWRRQDSLV